MVTVAVTTELNKHLFPYMVTDLDLSDVTDTVTIFGSHPTDQY